MRRQQFALFIEHANKQFAVALVVESGVYGRNFLNEKLKSTALDGLAHLLHPAGQVMMVAVLQIGCLKYAHAIAAVLAGHQTGRVGGTQGIGEVRGGGIDTGDAPTLVLTSKT